MLSILSAEGGSSTWIMLVVIGVLMVFMILMSVLPQKKRQKAAQEMMSKLSKGDKIKTIGGFVGTINAIDNGTNTLVINVGNDANPVLVTIDKSAIYTVLNSVNGNNNANNSVPEAIVEEGPKSLEDIEEDTKVAEKKAKKAKKPVKNEEETAIEVPSEEIVEADNLDDKNDEVQF